MPTRCTPSIADRLIVALDAPALAPALRVAKGLRGLIRTVKVGSILFTACGPTILHRLHGLGFGIMLDLKFFDIPTTVERSCEAAARHRVSWLTVHAAGTQAMLEAAVRGARAGAGARGRHRPRVLAVTVLTSVAGRRRKAVRQEVLRLAQRALRAGCDGVVASAEEAPALRKRFGARLRIVCPGIRPARAGRGDQRRVCTPADALARGADALVIGRPVTAAAHPRRAAERILKEMGGSRAC